MPPTARPDTRRASRANLKRWLLSATIGAIALAFVSAAFFGDNGSEPASAGIATSPSGYAHQVGEPGPGEVAPQFTLPATTGAFDLADHRGQRLLLYFQEGLMCQPCWDQLVEIERRWDEFGSLGIDAVASVTTDGLDELRQKVAIEKLATPVLADPDKDVSRRYEGLDYGMMGGSHNGHSFLVIGPDGTVEWRADYGGAPDYTMYLPVDALLEDLAAGLGGAGT